MSNKPQTFRNPARRPALAVFMACLIHSSQAYCAPGNNSQIAAEDYFLEQMPVVLSASRLAQSQYETPVAVTIIDRAMIDASGVLDIPDLLRLVPGFQVSHASGHTTSATYHGLADEHARRMQVLIDGRPVYGAALGGVRWTDIPIDIEDIERIEVVRGPNSAAYGANSFLGAINITTVHSAQAQGDRAQLLLGNKDTQKYYYRHGGQQEKLSYRVSLVRRNDDGFKEYMENVSNVDTHGYRIDGKRVSIFNLRTDYVAPNYDNWEIHLGYNGGPRGEGRSIPDFDDPMRVRDVQSHFQQVRWTRTLSPDNEISVLAHHTYMKHSESAYSAFTIGEILGLTPAQVLSNYGKPDERLLLDFSVFEERLEAELQHKFRIDPSWRVVWGVSSRFDRVKAPGKFYRNDYIENQLHRLFGNLEWHVNEKTIANFGTMIENSKVAGTQISPRLAVNYQLAPNHGLRTSLSRAVRMPTIHEQYVDTRYGFAGGPALDIIYASPDKLSPERMTSLEFGYLGRWPEKHLTLDAKVYHNEIENRIHTVKDLDFPGDPNKVVVYMNSGDVNLNGAEFSLTWRPTYRTMAVFNYAYMKGKGWALNAIDNPANPHDTENLKDDVPTHTRSLMVMHRFNNNWDASLTYYKVSAMKWLGAGDKLLSQDRIDVRIGKNFTTASGKRMQIALTLQNLLDEYKEFRDENLFDTRGYLEARVEF